MQDLKEDGGDGWTLSDAIFPGMRSVTVKIDGGTYAEQSDSFAPLNEAIFLAVRSAAGKIALSQRIF
jgi:hypothetical protein